MSLPIAGDMRELMNSQDNFGKGIAHIFNAICQAASVSTNTTGPITAEDFTTDQMLALKVLLQQAGYDVELDPSVSRVITVTWQV